MDRHDFIARYAGIYEHSPWVAQHVAAFAADIDDSSRLRSSWPTASTMPIPNSNSS